MERLQVRQPTKNDELTEVFPKDLDERRLYIIEQAFTSFDIFRYKGIFLGSTTIDDTSNPPVIESRFQIQEYPEFLGNQHNGLGLIEGFSNYQTRYYLPAARRIKKKQTNDVVGKDLAKSFYQPEPTGTKGGTKRTKRAKKGTKTKRTKRAKKGTKTKTKRTT